MNQVLLKIERKYPSILSACSIVLLLTCWLIVILRLWGGGFTGGDEGATAQASHISGGLINASYQLAADQGRFYQIFAYTLAQIPYIFGDLRWINACRIISTAAPILCFYYFVYRVAGFPEAISILSILLLIMDTVGYGAGMGYNPFNALPMWFNFSLCFLFLSIVSYVNSLSAGTRPSIAYVLFFVFILFYEINILYLLIYPFIYFLYKQDGSSKFNFRIIANFINENMGLFISVGIYLFLYISFRYYHPSHYVGASGLSWGDLRSFASTVLVFSVNGAYIRNIFTFPEQLSLQSAYITSGLIFILLINLRSIYKQNKYSDDKIPNAYLIVFAIVISALIPNILYGLTEKYREWAASPYPYYIGSYYSAFSLSGLFFVVLLSVYRYNLICFLLILLLFNIGYQNQTQSIGFFNRSKQDSVRWIAAKKIAKILNNENFSQINRICTVTFIGYNKDIYGYWSYYLTKMAGRKIQLVYDNGQANCDASMDYDGASVVFKNKLDSGNFICSIQSC